MLILILLKLKEYNILQILERGLTEYHTTIIFNVFVVII